MVLKLMIQELQELKMVQRYIVEDFMKDLPKIVYTKYFNNPKFIEWKVVMNDLDIDKHRYYNISTIVLELIIRGIKYYMGVRGISDIKSDSISLSGCGSNYEFFEMYQVLEPTYLRKVDIS